MNFNAEGKFSNRKARNMLLRLRIEADLPEFIDGIPIREMIVIPRSHVDLEHWFKDPEVVNAEILEKHGLLIHKLISKSV